MVDIFDATFAKLIEPLAAAAGQPVSVVPDLFGAHLDVGGLVVARAVEGADGLHLYANSGVSLGHAGVDSFGHGHGFDASGMPAFHAAPIGQEVAFSDGLHSLGGASDGPFGVTPLHDASGLTTMDLHHHAFDAHDAFHDGFHDMHGAFADAHHDAFEAAGAHHDALADFHASALDSMDFHHDALHALGDYGDVADHLHNFVDLDIF